MYIKRQRAGLKIRYLAGFQSLLKHPQLLGSTMLLLGIWSGVVDVPETVQQSPRPSTSSPKRQSPQRNSSLQGKIAVQKDPPLKIIESSQQIVDNSGNATNTHSVKVVTMVAEIENDLSRPILSLQKESEPLTVYTKYLDRPAIKIQSAFRMWRYNI